MDRIGEKLWCASGPPPQGRRPLSSTRFTVWVLIVYRRHQDTDILWRLVIKIRLDSHGLGVQS